MAAIDQLTGLVNVIQAFKGQEGSTKSSTSSTKTTQTNISDAGVSQLIDQILSGAGGVKSVGNAARKSGLYNSTTEDKQLAELYSDAAVKAELARSPTTTTESGNSETTATTGGIGGMGTLGAIIGGGMLLNSLFGGKDGKSGLGGLLGGSGNGGSGGITDALSGLFGGGEATASGATSSGGSGFGLGQNVVGGGTNDILSGLTGGESGDSLLSGLFGGGGSASGGGAGGTTAASSGVSLGSMLPYGGAFLGGLLGGQGEGSGKTEDYMGSATSGAMSGFAVGGPYGAALGALAGLAGVGISDQSVICTALHKQGLISKELHAAGHKYLVMLHPATRLGYYLWAEKIAAKIDNGNKFLKWAFFVPTWCYLSLIASNRGILDYLENPIGAAVKLIGEPLCKLLGNSHLSLKMLEN